MHAKGTLVEFISGNSVTHGFVIGTCSYDNSGKDNAYVIRYVCKEMEDEPRKPYTIMAFDEVRAVKDWPDIFHVCGHWDGTPDDRCKKWLVVKKHGILFIVPKKDKPAEDPNAIPPQVKNYLDNVF